MDKFVLRLDKAIDTINDADYVLIGAGAGFSAAAGIEYSGKRFEDNFADFIEKYGVTDMYSATFYPYKTQEAKWAHWNHQFWINGFEDERIFATQGDYGLMQCETACHNKLYSNRELVFEAIENTHDCMIPSDLVPICPVCGGNMEINVRKDNYFVEDEKWREMHDNYSKFLERIGTDDRLVLLELGVGFNTPIIIRYPFEQMTHDNPNVNLIRLNRSYAQAIPENKDKTISFDEEISEIFDYWTKRM